MSSLKKFMAKIDREKVRKAFDRGACRYEETVIVQKLVIESILSELSKLKPSISPRRILDVGAGTGMLLRSLQNYYPEAFLAGLDLAPGMGIEAINSFQEEGNHLYVQGDAEKLPFADGTFDLVVSTSTYQWLSVLEQAFSEAKRVLAPGGIFLFALFGEGTLSELRNSYQRALSAENTAGKDRTHHFFSPGEVQRALAQPGFADVVVNNSLEKEYYPDVAAFLRSLKGIGAGTTACMPAKGLGGRRIITKMMEFYQRDFLEKMGVPVSYQVIYGRGRKV
jgi:malonyl-CoA O-methyltransferase